MRKLIFILVLLTPLVVGLYFGLGFLKNNVGDIRPAILPTSSNLPTLVEKNEVGESVDFPLKIKAGFKIGVFAKDLGKARDLLSLDSGVILVSSLESGKVYALEDKDKDGKADKNLELLKGLNTPHGLAFYNNQLFVAEVNKLVRYNFDQNTLKISEDKKILDLPTSGGHTTRSLVFNAKGQLFVSIGSTCNICDEKNEWFASVIVTDKDGNSPRVYSKGLRNGVFLTLNPESDQIFTGEMGRDLLGDTTPPDEVDILKEGADYGWPTCYSDQMYDKNFGGEDDCKNTEPPVFKLCAHCAPLGLTFIKSAQFPEEDQGNLLLSLHGSWNSSVPVGYKVVQLKVEGDKITSSEDFLTGFLSGSEALGRPVDLEFDKQGNLYLSDDKAGVVYKISQEN